MDVRFDLPSGRLGKNLPFIMACGVDMTSDEKDELDDKLQQLNRILEREVRVYDEYYTLT